MSILPRKTTSRRSFITDGARRHLGDPDPVDQKFTAPSEPAVFPAEKVARISTRTSLTLDLLLEMDRKYAKDLVVAFETTQQQDNLIKQQMIRYQNPFYGVPTEALSAVGNQPAGLSVVGIHRTQGSERLIAEALLPRMLRARLNWDIENDGDTLSLWSDPDWSAHDLYQLLGLASYYEKGSEYLPLASPYKEGRLRHMTDPTLDGLTSNPLWGIENNLRSIARANTYIDVARSNYAFIHDAFIAGFGAKQHTTKINNSLGMGYVYRIGVDKPSSSILHWAAWDILRLPDGSSWLNEDIADENLVANTDRRTALVRRIAQLMGELGFADSYLGGAPSIMQNADTLTGIWSVQNQGYQNLVLECVMDYFDNRTHRGNRLSSLRTVMKDNIPFSAGEFHNHVTLLIRNLLAEGTYVPFFPARDFRQAGLLEQSTLWHIRWFMHRQFNAIVTHEHPTFALFIFEEFFSSFPEAIRLQQQFGV